MVPPVEKGRTYKKGRAQRVVSTVVLAQEIPPAGIREGQGWPIRAEHPNVTLHLVTLRYLQTVTRWLDGTWGCAGGLVPVSKQFTRLSNSRQGIIDSHRQKPFTSHHLLLKGPQGAPNVANQTTCQLPLRTFEVVLLSISYQPCIYCGQVVGSNPNNGDEWKTSLGILSIPEYFDYGYAPLEGHQLIAIGERVNRPPLIYVIAT